MKIRMMVRACMIVMRRMRKLGMMRMMVRMGLSKVGNGGENL